MKKACVVGWPITHSRSPLIHGYWLKKYGIAGSYDRLAVAPEEFSAFLANFPSSGLAGFNITAPHKEKAAQLISQCDERVRRTGSANTVYIKDGQPYATSSDGTGFCNNVLSNMTDWSFDGKTVLILGAGGSARAIIDELLRRRVKAVHIVNRTLARAQELQMLFGHTVLAHPIDELDHLLPETDLLVNTTNQGQGGQNNPALDMTRLKRSAVVADIVYTPLKTQILRDAEVHGCHIVPGLGMLLHQAVVGFEQWFGMKPEVTQDLYDLVARDIDPEYRP